MNLSNFIYATSIQNVNSKWLMFLFELWVYTWLNTYSYNILFNIKLNLTKLVDLNLSLTKLSLLTLFYLLSWLELVSFPHLNRVLFLLLSSLYRGEIWEYFSSFNAAFDSLLQLIIANTSHVFTVPLARFSSERVYLVEESEGVLMKRPTKDKFVLYNPN